jgi:hypothetical protein
MALFEDFGYSLFDFYNLGRGSGRLLQLDAIFVSPAALAAHEARLAGAS